MPRNFNLSEALRNIEAYANSLRAELATAKSRQKDDRRRSEKTAGPIITGALADRLGLGTAMKYVPLAALLAIVLLLIGRRAYPSSIQRLEATAAAGGGKE